MTLFFISATLLVLLSMAWILYGLFRGSHLSTDHEAVNITLARERAQTLDIALADGSIDQSTFDYEREQLEHDLAADLRLENETRTRSGGQISAAVLVSIFVPLAAGALYLQLGNPGAIALNNAPVSSQANTGSAANQNAPDVAELLPEMEQRLEQQPDDIEGWRLLGRSYLSIGEFDKARSAFERAVQLDEEDAPTLAQLAEAIAMTQRGDLSGEPLTYINRALELDANNEHAIWLLAIAQQQIGNHEAAMQGFDKLTAMAEGNPEALATVEQMRARSVAALSGVSAPPRAQSDSNADAVTTESSISVTVNLSDQARSEVKDSQLVYVYATASEGPPMPLAVSKLTVADLPATVRLDNTMAMIPNMVLSGFPSVTVGARVSSSGNPVAQPGDWFNEVFDIETNESSELSLTIDTRTP